ncbi:hypothetical protein M0805_009584 [Coniferiporia weirii]|nr:hypothetical protein M0805_009584 [Coniferiporia weirii]
MFSFTHSVLAALISLLTVSVSVHCQTNDTEINGYIYGYSPVVLARTRNNFLCTTPGGTTNIIFPSLDLSTPGETTIVAPNVDTLYAIAWLDLREGPVVLSIPETDGRYHVFQLLDMYTNTFADIGSRTVGYSAGSYAVVHPGFDGTLPDDLPMYESPTWDVWINARTLVSNGSDITLADAIVLQYNLTTLSDLKPLACPPALVLNCTDPLPDPQTPNDAGAAFFDELATVLAADPPPAADAPALASLASLGVIPGGTPTNTANTTELALAVSAGNSYLESQALTPFPEVPAGTGWRSSIDGGTYGTNYFLRAAITKGGLGANIPAESVYYVSQTFNGTDMNVASFVPGNLPPVDEGGFWSITVYNEDLFLYANPENRYALGDRSNLTFESDGTLNIYLSSSPPLSNETTNWIPTPEDAFELFVRAPPSGVVLTEYTSDDDLLQLRHIVGSGRSVFASPAVSGLSNARA